MYYDVAHSNNQLSTVQQAGNMLDVLSVSFESDVQPDNTFVTLGNLNIDRKPNHKARWKT